MEKTAILKEWFDRVDSDKTGSITAIQLKVFSFPAYLCRLLLYYYRNVNQFVVLCACLFTDGLCEQSVFDIGNLEFPISVVEQMIRMYDFDRNGTMSFDGRDSSLLCIASVGPICFCQAFWSSLHNLIENSSKTANSNESLSLFVYL